MAVKSFNPDKVIIFINDTFLVTGKGSSEFVTITNKIPQYEQLTDIDGEVFFIKTVDGSTEIKLTLRDNSEAIDFINEYILQINGGTVSGINITIVDLNKADYPKVYIGDNCKVNQTDNSRGVKIGEKQFTFLPAKYYNEWESASEGTSQALNDAIFSFVDNKLKVKGE